MGNLLTHNQRSREILGRAGVRGSAFQSPQDHTRSASGRVCPHLAGCCQEYTHKNIHKYRCSIEPIISTGLGRVLRLVSSTHTWRTRGVGAYVPVVNPGWLAKRSDNVEHVITCSDNFRRRVEHVDGGDLKDKNGTDELTRTERTDGQERSGRTDKNGQTITEQTNEL